MNTLLKLSREAWKTIIRLIYELIMAILHNHGKENFNEKK